MKPRKKKVSSRSRQSNNQIDKKTGRSVKNLIPLAFCLSGFAGLMHQVVWAKLLTGLIGTTAHAQAVVIAVFMAGLAIGSVLFGLRVDKKGRPLRTYLILEVVIAVYCLLLPLFLWFVQSGYDLLAGYLFESTTLTFSLRFSLAFLLILFPAVLMGGTLPVLARYLVSGIDQTRKHIAKLYALNSFGAVLGAATAGFLTLPLLGIYASLAVAAALNLIAAMMVFKPSRSESKSEGDFDQPLELSSDSKPASYGKLQYQATLVALALSGFAALGYEVLITRIIALSFGSSAYSFTVMLMSFILGISIGSAIISRVRVKNPLWLFGLSQIFVVIALLAVTPFASKLPYLIGLLRIELQGGEFGFELYQLGKVVLCLGILLLPTIFIGFGFPLVAQIQARRSSDLGYRIGVSYAWNTVGNVLGAVLTSLVLLPLLGLLNAFHFNIALNLIAGIVVLMVAKNLPQIYRVGPVVAGLIVAISYLLIGTNWLDSINYAPNHLRLAAKPEAILKGVNRSSQALPSFDDWRREYVIDPKKQAAFYFEEDAQTTVLAIDDGQRVRLFVNNKPDASTSNDLPTQVLLAHLPMLLVPQSEEILIIGHGSGITAGSLLRHPIKHADIVEISSAVLNADRLFSEFNYDVLDDPRVSVYREDGQSFLRAVPRRYDLILSEPSNPWVAGISGLFTKDFYQHMSDKLNPGGVAVLWFQTYEQSDEGVQLVLRTIGSVFPHAIIGRSPFYSDIIVIASNDPIEPNFSAMEDRFDQPAIRNDLARIGITNLASLILHYVISLKDISMILPPGPINTISHQRLEYSAPRSLFDQDSSYFIQRNDPLLSNKRLWRSTILSRYFRYRAVDGDPVRYDELSHLIKRSQTQVANALNGLKFSRSTQQDSPTRSSRGKVPDPVTAGLYEAAFWSNRFRKEGHSYLASSYLQRFKLLSK